MGTVWSDNETDNKNKQHFQKQEKHSLFFKDWVGTCSKRVRTMLRHVSQAEIRSPRLPWLRQLALPPRRLEARMIDKVPFMCLDGCTFVVLK